MLEWMYVVRGPPTSPQPFCVTCRDQAKSAHADIDRQPISLQPIAHDMDCQNVKLPCLATIIGAEQ